MNINTVVQVCWQFYENGRPSATNQTLEQDDLAQMIYMEAAYQLKLRFYQSRKDNDGEKTDFIAGLLGTRVYDLGDVNYHGKRSALYNEEVMRLPKNMDVTNVYMVGGCDDEIINGEITQVQPGEENFYINDTDLSTFKFFVQKGRSIDTYNVPVGITKIAVERIYTTDDLDIPLDMAYEIVTSVLGISLKVRGFMPTEDNPSDGNRNQLRYQLEEQDKKGM